MKRRKRERGQFAQRVPLSTVFLGKGREVGGQAYVSGGNCKERQAGTRIHV